MLTIYIPLPEGHRYPNDEDAWFLESLAELVNETLHSLGASVGGFETGPDDVGLCVFGADPTTMAREVTSLLRRHCPPGTYLQTFYDEGEDGESEDIPLFSESDLPAGEPLPLSSPEFAYRAIELQGAGEPPEFADDDKYIFKAIATSLGLKIGQLNDAIDAAERIRLTDEQLARGIARLTTAGYIHSEGDCLLVSKRLAEELPRTAKGNVSAYRDEAWDRVYRAFFSGTG